MFVGLGNFGLGGGFDETAPYVSLTNFFSDLIGSSFFISFPLVLGNLVEFASVVSVEALNL